MLSVFSVDKLDLTNCPSTQTTAKPLVRVDMNATRQVDKVRAYLAHVMHARTQVRKLWLHDCSVLLDVGLSSFLL